MGVATSRCHSAPQAAECVVQAPGGLTNNGIVQGRGLAALVNAETGLGECPTPFPVCVRLGCDL